jgi:hypothetical protein
MAYLKLCKIIMAWFQFTFFLATPLFFKKKTGDNGCCD